MSKAASIREHIRTKLEDETHLGFFPTEYWLLCFMTNDLKNILDDKYLNDIRSYDSQGVDLPTMDNVGDWLREQGNARSSELLNRVNSSGYGEKDKDLLHIVLLYSLRTKTDSKDSLQVSINQAAKKFTQENPSSLATPFIATYVIREYVGTGTAQELAFGGGFSLPLGGLAGCFDPGLIINIEGKQYFSWFVLGASVGISNGKTNSFFTIKDGKDSSLIEAGTNYSSYFAGLDLGLRLLDGKSASLVVVGGPALSDFAVRKKTGVSETEIMLKNPLSIHACAMVDFKILKRGKYANYKRYSDYNSYVFVRLKYEYQMPFLDKNYAMDGAMHNFGIQLGSNSKKIRKQ